MARATNKLNETQLSRGKLPVGIHSDGAGLYVRVQGNSTAFVFIYHMHGKRREAGLGAYPTTKLSIARQKAQALRDQIATGVDPLDAKAALNVPTVREIMEGFIESNRPVWRPKVIARYQGYVENHLGALNAMTIDQITTPLVIATLAPIWHKMPATGRYIRSMLERAIDWAVVAGHRPEGLNPARYKGHIEAHLKQARHETKHHKSMPHELVPEFYKALTARGTMPATALRFTILCGLRQRECREMTWSEVDFDAGIFTIPASRAKTKRAFRVALSRQAVELLRSLDRTSAFVFPRSNGLPLSHMAFDQTLAALKADCTSHGFRSTLVTWGTHEGGYTNELMQRVLSHVIGDETSRAYDRSDYLEARRPVMQAWADFAA